MTSLRPPTIGILPAGALGVALFHHLTAGSTRGDGEVVFYRRLGASAGSRALAGGDLTVETDDGARRIPAALQREDLLRAAEEARLPDIVLVCTNPDQVFEVLREYVAVIEEQHRRGALGARGLRLPALLLCANGIYFQRVRQTFIELLEEATLFGRLPDLWPELMPAIVGRLLRGVTMQTGLRRGQGGAAVYRPGLRGRTVVAGGLDSVRAWVVAELAKRGGWYEDAAPHSPTRAEFDKALVNLAGNLLGIIRAVDATGRFRVLTVGELTAEAQQPRIRELTEAVFRVGRALQVYSEQDDVNSLYEEVMRLNRAAARHVPSSLQWLEAQLAAGTLPPGLSPTEEWLLKPLQQYARALGAPDLITYFENLEAELRAALARAARSRPHD